MHLNVSQHEQILQLSQRLEKGTGVQFLVAVVGKCDAYAEIPWKAFALGASASALVVVLYAILMPEANGAWSVWLHLAWVLGLGALAALLTPFWAGFARLFLDRERAAAETLQYAHGLFLEHELFQTHERKAILLLVGLFEHQVVILPDKGLKNHLCADIFKGIIDRMVPHLRQGDAFRALSIGIGLLEEALVMAGFEGSADAANPIADMLIQEKGDS